MEVVNPVQDLIQQWLHHIPWNIDLFFVGLCRSMELDDVLNEINRKPYSYKNIWNHQTLWWSEFMGFVRTPHQQIHIPYTYIAIQLYFNIDFINKIVYPRYYKICIPGILDNPLIPPLTIFTFFFSDFTLCAIYKSCIICISSCRTVAQQ